MAIKHSKFKNTGILFELLVRQITSDVLNGTKNSPAMKIMETHFKSATELGKELILYRSFFSDFKKPLSENRAMDFLSMVYEQRSKLSNKRLAEEKYALVKSLKEHYDVEDFFSHRVPSYRIYASIFKNLEAKVKGVTVSQFDDLVEAKSTILEHLTGGIVPEAARKESEITSAMREQDEGLRLLTYRVLLEKFNDKYEALSVKQKNLLREYINNVSNRTALVELVHTESTIVAKNIKHCLARVTNPVTEIKLEEVVHQLEELSRIKVVKNSHLTALMIGYEIEKQLEEALQ